MPRECASLILVVEDDKATRTLVSRAIQDEPGWSCLTCGSSGEALQVVNAGRSAVWVIDYGLPEMTGLELIHVLRTQPGGQDAFAIMISALSRDPLILASVRDGWVDRFLPKPFELDELVAVMREGVSARRAH